MKSKRSCNLRACTIHVFMFRRPRRFSRPWEAGSAAGNPGFLISIIFRTTGTQRSHGVVAITASWKSRRGSRWRFLQCSKLGQKKKKNKCSKLLGERSAGREGNGGEKRVLPACCRVWGQLCGGDGAWAFILAAPLSPAITVLLHGPGNYPTVDIKDVDSGGDAVENDGTHLPVPIASSPNMLLVPGTVSASPRYVSAQAWSPAPGGSHPHDGAGTGKCIQPHGTTHFWQVWTTSWGDVCVAGITPMQGRGDGKSLTPCLHFLSKWSNFV